MRLAIAPGPTVHWLFRSRDLPSRFSAMASRMCGTGRRNRAVKHMYVSPLLTIVVVVSAVLLVPNFIFTEATRGSYRFETARVAV